MFFNIIAGIATGVGVAGIIATLTMLYKYEPDGESGEGFVWRLSDLDTSEFWRTVIVGLIVGVICAITPALPSWGLPEIATAVISMAFLITIITLMVFTVCWFCEEGESNVELALTLALVGILLLVTFSVANIAAAGMTAPMQGVFNFLLPLLAGIAAVAVILSNALRFRAEMAVTDDKIRLFNNLNIGVFVIAGIIAVALIGSFAWGQIGKVGAVSGVRQASAAEGNSWVHFYNLDLQNDGDKDNDFNFGPNPYKENEAKDAKYYDTEFRERLKKDPALAAADTAWLDANVGTRYLGEFYESCQHDWAKTMNEAKERFAADQSAYYKNLDAYFRFLDAAESVTLEPCHGVSDQMYMNPYTPTGNPDVIVMRTDDHSGWELVYTFRIKDNIKKVAYRINCGYQPTDVEAVMGITPQSAPEPQPVIVPGDNPSSDPQPQPGPNPGTDPQPQPSDNPSSDPQKQPGGDPSSDPQKQPGDNPDSYDKDPNKGPDVKPGEPDPNTNNPEDPNHSTADRPDNSTSFPDYDTYRDWMDELEEINDNQQVGGDPNTPSTPTPPETTVDNNADQGTGYGGIDTPTPVSEPAHEADTGRAIDSTPGEAWGGPKD